MSPTAAIIHFPLHTGKQGTPPAKAASANWLLLKNCSNHLLVKFLPTLTTLHWSIDRGLLPPIQQQQDRTNTNVSILFQSRWPEVDLKWGSRARI